MSFKIAYTYQLIDQFTKPLRKIENQVKRVEGRLAGFSTQANKTQVALGRVANKSKIASKNFNELAGKVDRFNRAARASGAPRLTSQIQDLKSRASELRGQLFDAAAMGFVFAQPIKQAMRFESVMADVNKVVNFKTPKQFIEMQRIIKQMGVSTSLGAKGIGEIVAAGGRLGIDPGKLPDFAKTVAKASVAFDMLPGTAGDALASISNKMRIPLSEIELMADSVNHLSDTTAAKAPNMINILGRISGEMASIKMPPAAAAGLAAFADQVEVTPELAASGVRMMITRMQRIPGMTKRLLADPQKSIVDLLTKLKAVPEAARPELIRKMFGDEAGRFVRKAVAGIDLYQKTMDKVADKTKFAGSMTREFNVRMNTSERAMARAKAQIQNAAINIGSVLLPALVSLFAIVESVTGGIASFADQYPFLTKVVMGTVGALIALRLATVAAMFAGVQMKLAWATMMAFFAGTKAAIIGVTAVVRGLGIATRGLLMATGIGVLVVAVSLLAEHWETVWGWAQKFWDFLKFVSGYTAMQTLMGDGEAGDQSAVAKQAKAQMVNVNGQISVSATGGASVNSAESFMDGPGDLGFNMP